MHIVWLFLNVMYKKGSFTESLPQELAHWALLEIEMLLAQSPSDLWVKIAATKND